jgi:hypothetical protein
MRDKRQSFGKKGLSLIPGLTHLGTARFDFILKSILTLSAFG